MVPLVLVCAVNVARHVTDRKPGRRGDRWFEGALALAAVGSAGVAWIGARALAAAGGFAAHPLPFTLAPLRLLWTHTWLAFDPEEHDATFLVAAAPPGPAGDPATSVPPGVVRATFGAPNHVYRFAGYTVDVWDVNLLTKLRK